MTEETNHSSLAIACPGCKRVFPPEKLGRMARLPLALGRLFHLTPTDEGERFYCPRCRSSQNFGMVGLVAIGSAAMVGHWIPMATVVIMLTWLAGSCIWLLFCMCRVLHRLVVGTDLERTKSP